MNKHCLHGVLLFGILSVAVGCKDESDIVLKSPEDRMIQNYILQNGLTSVVQRTPSGLYYRTISGGSGVAPADSAYVLVEYTTRELKGNGTDGAYLDATNRELIAEKGLYPLFRFGGPALFQVGSTAYDSGLSEGLKLMHEGDSAQFFMNAALVHTTDDKAKEFYIRLTRVLSDISEVDQQLVTASLDTITGGYASVLVQDNAKNIREYMYMSHLKQGVGNYPTVGDTMDLKYTGRFLDGRVFDQSDSSRFIVSSTSTILGFMESCRHLKKGGKATFIMPSILGYGKNGKMEYTGNFRVYQYIIPPYSPLVFDIEILGINQ